MSFRPNKSVFIFRRYLAKKCIPTIVKYFFEIYSNEVFVADVACKIELLKNLRTSDKFHLLVKGDSGFPFYDFFSDCSFDNHYSDVR